MQVTLEWSESSATLTMSESPTKRQRLSVDTYRVTKGAVDEGQTDITNPTTPTRRASYLSPTKASLARSHPHILAKSPKRGSTTEPRGKLLRQELLGSRSNTDSFVPKSAPRSLQSGRPNTLASTADPDKEGFVEAIIQSFGSAAEDVPDVDPPFEPTSRSPLRIRQPPSTLIDKELRDPKIQARPSEILPVPRLVKKQDKAPRQPSEARNEPELPPTPVQLGIGVVPERPRGLASSSSMGSRSGSGRHRRRIREGAANVLSSPLKPKNARPLSPTDFSDIAMAENDPVEEAPESDAEGQGVRQKNAHGPSNEGDDRDEFPEALRDKRQELAGLQTELEKLRNELINIGALVDRLQQEGEIGSDEVTLNLLKHELQSGPSSLQASELHPSFLKNQHAYLGLFTPGNLRFKHETVTTRIQDKPKVMHMLTLAAPPPWPADALHLLLDVAVDVANSQVERVVAITSGNHRCGMIHEWTQKRLDDKLHKHDISGIVWGVGQYFDACIKRANVLRTIDEQYNNVMPHSFTGKGNVNNSAVLPPTRYLYQTQLEITDPATATSRQSKRSIQTSTKRALLSYDIHLNWTGDAENHIDISLTGISGEAQKAAKELFYQIVLSDGVAKALDAVWDLVGFNHDHQPGHTAKKQRSTTRKSIEAE